MVQEVQTQWNRYQTPEIIPWVWISERKIKEHTQVTPSKTYSCSWSSWTASWLVWGANPDITCYANFTISSQSWGVEFKIVDGWIRIPLAWIYEITWTAQWWLTWIAAQNHLEIDWKTISTITTNAGSASKTFRTNLWKFDIIKYNFTAHYWGSDGNWISSRVTSITIQKL